jgi:hypothetical protein
MKWAPFRRGLVVFVSLFGFYSIAINLTANNWPNLYRLAKSGAPTQATVMAIHPENHGACDFVYVIDGRSYSHSESCHLLVGEVSPLIYLPSEPSVALIRSADEELEASIVGPLIIFIACGILATLGTLRPGGHLASKIE